jgi:hypothetical protein
LKTAWLCVRRSFEIRGMARDAITEAAILWSDSKNSNKPKALIHGSPELRETIDEVLAIKCNDLAGSFLLFGTLQGHRYTKSG